MAKNSNAPTIRKVAVALDTHPANIDVTFEMGGGQITVKLYRDQKFIAGGNLDNSGRITLNDVQKNDSIAVTGLCTGTAIIEIDVKTKPTTSKKYPKGFILGRIDIL